MSSSVHPAAFASLTTSSGRTVSRDVAAAGVPWYIWTGVAGITSATVGAAWDVAWHRSIGRDSFWTPAHLMIQLCGILAAVVGLWLVYQCTFNKQSALRAASVSVFGLRAPLGVFLAGWGGVAMITSAPFDNWWHNAYGLDVKIVSPPHTLLILGIRAVSLGVFFLILATMNRAAAEGATSFSTLQKLLLYLGGLTVGGQMFFLQEYTWDVGLHQALPYIAMAIAVPVVFALISQASRFKWAATTTAAIYMAFIIGEILIFPLVGAEPKLGPVYNPVTHLVPAKFPILLIVPAIALDLLWQKAKNWETWQIALVSGFVFVALLTAVEWRFATFLLSKASENRFFGTTYFDYNARPDSEDRMRVFYHPAWGWPLYFGLMRAAVYAAISTWVGLVFGRWMRGVQR
jgi:hypothetical protein